MCASLSPTPEGPAQGVCRGRWEHPYPACLETAQCSANNVLRHGLAHHLCPGATSCLGTGDHPCIHICGFPVTVTMEPVFTTPISSDTVLGIQSSRRVFWGQSQGLGTSELLLEGLARPCSWPSLAGEHGSICLASVRETVVALGTPGSPTPPSHFMLVMAANPFGHTNHRF